MNNPHHFPSSSQLRPESYSSGNVGNSYFFNQPYEDDPYQASSLQTSSPYINSRPYTSTPREDYSSLRYSLNGNSDYMQYEDLNDPSQNFYQPDYAYDLPDYSDQEFASPMQRMSCPPYRPSSPRVLNPEMRYSSGYLDQAESDSEACYSSSYSHSLKPPSNPISYVSSSASHYYSDYDPSSEDLPNYDALDSPHDFAPYSGTQFCSPYDSPDPLHPQTGRPHSSIPLSSPLFPQEPRRPPTRNSSPFPPTQNSHSSLLKSRYTPSSFSSPSGTGSLPCSPRHFPSPLQSKLRTNSMPYNAGPSYPSEHQIQPSGLHAETNADSSESMSPYYNSYQRSSSPFKLNGPSAALDSDLSPLPTSGSHYPGPYAETTNQSESGRPSMDSSSTSTPKQYPSSMRPSSIDAPGSFSADEYSFEHENFGPSLNATQMSTAAPEDFGYAPRLPHAYHADAYYNSYQPSPSSPYVSKEEGSYYDPYYRPDSAPHPYSSHPLPMEEPYAMDPYNSLPMQQSPRIYTASISSAADKSSSLYNGPGSMADENARLPGARKSPLTILTHTTNRMTSLSGYHNTRVNGYQAPMRGPSSPRSPTSSQPLYPTIQVKVQTKAFKSKPATSPLASKPTKSNQKKSDTFKKMRDDILAICIPKVYKTYEQKRAELLDLLNVYNHNYYIYIEISKLDVDNCKFSDAVAILLNGLEYNPQNEIILHKLLRAEERIRDYDSIEAHLNCLAQLGGKSWRGIVDGVYILARHGQITKGKKMLEEIHMYTKKSQGAVFLEKAKYCLLCGDIITAVSLLVQAIQSRFKCTPLYFYLFNIYEYVYLCAFFYRDILMNKGLCSKNPLTIYNLFVKRVLDRSIGYMYEAGRVVMNLELKWKFYYIQGQYLFRYVLTLRIFIYEHPEYMDIYKRIMPSLLSILRTRFALSLSVCPTHLKWKVWLMLCRTEALVGCKSYALKCYENCFSISSPRNYSIILMEHEKLKALLHCSVPEPDFSKSSALFSDEWKIYIEQCHILVRNNRAFQGYQLLKNSIDHYQGAGRLWATYIQFTHQLYGPTYALYAFFASLRHVSRSGEVWVEAARLYLSPLSPFFSLSMAQKCLNYAMHFTPQYGDVYIEVYRLHLLMSKAFLLYYDLPPAHLFHILISTSIDHFSNVSLFNDPNYGPLWFTAKSIPYEPARDTLETARLMTAATISQYAIVYHEAIVKSMECKMEAIPLSTANILEERYSVGEGLQYEAFCAAFNVENSVQKRILPKEFNDVDQKLFFKRIHSVKAIYGNCRIDV